MAKEMSGKIVKRFLEKRLAETCNNIIWAKDHHKKRILTGLQSAFNDVKDAYPFVIDCDIIYFDIHRWYRSNYPSYDFETSCLKVRINIHVQMTPAPTRMQITSLELDYNKVDDRLLGSDTIKRNRWLAVLEASEEDEIPLNQEIKQQKNGTNTDEYKLSRNLSRFVSMEE